MVDGWELRSAGGFTKRANSVQPFGPSSRSLSEKLAECEDWYESRGLPTVFRVTPFADADLDALLEERKYRVVEPTDVLSMPVGAPFEDLPRAVVEVDAEEWIEKYVTLSAGAASTVPLLRSILHANRQPRFLGVMRTVEHVEHVACGIAVLDQQLVGCSIW